MDRRKRNIPETVERLAASPDTAKRTWCRMARLVRIRGSGALRWEQRGGTGDGDFLLRLTLRGTPLLSRQAPLCPTCGSLLAAGWGMDAAECPELDQIRETLNGGFTCLDDAIPALSPMLGLLEPGVYALADGDVFPADGVGRFFWDVPDGPVPAAATAPVGLTDDDFEYEYPPSAPVFLYPSQRRSRLDEERVSFYMGRFRQSAPLRGIALHVAEGVSLLLDGHHKAAAAARLGRMLPCLTVFPLESYEWKTDPVRKRPERSRACFGPFAVPLKRLPQDALPEQPWKHRKGPQGPLEAGRLADRTLPEAYRAAGERCPTSREYALTAAAGIEYPTDEDLTRWLASPYEYRPRLRAALVLLRSRGDPRLKSLALRCAALPDRWCSLKEESFRVLAGMKGDSDAEAFFVDYFIQLETLPQDRPRGTEILTEIAHSFWI